jgi:hypothetical protein
MMREDRSAVERGRRRWGGAFPLERLFGGESPPSAAEATREDSVSTTDTGQQGQTEPMVANARHTALRQLLADVRAQVPALEAALDKGAKDMGSGQVWVGTTGSAFQQEIEGRRRRLRELAGQLEGIVSEALAREPERIPASLARARRMDRSL